MTEDCCSTGAQPKSERREDGVRRQGNTHIITQNTSHLDLFSEKTSLSCELHLTAKRMTRVMTCMVRSKHMKKQACNDRRQAAIAKMTRWRLRRSRDCVIVFDDDDGVRKV
jgi:hypothetical protein